jgi:hypothetical protein
MQRLASWQPGQAFHISAPPAFAEYEAAWPLDQAMPVNSTAPVTARDHFVIALTRSELMERCEAFCNPAISDDEIRERYFQRTRSRLYSAGDTRGWKLVSARARLRRSDWQQNIRRVLYRPFDWRYILWTDSMIDWPRDDVMTHLLNEENLALITRRQAPAGQPWNYAWIADGLTVDGVIRSDNRGSESLFPLWLNFSGERRANFHPRFFETVAAAVGCTPEPAEVFYYIYALLHATHYRRRYQAALATGFPRIPLPRSRDVFAALAQRGQELAGCHRCAIGLEPVPFSGEVPALVAPGHPRFADGRLHVNCDSFFAGVSHEVAGYAVGSHRVAIKLLKDRRRRKLHAADVQTLGGALASLAQSLRLTRQLDDFVGALDFGSNLSVKC